MSVDDSHASRVAVIHNAATRLGRAMALELAMQGFSLALCSSRPAVLESVVDEAFNSVEVSPFKVSAYECDVLDPKSVAVCAKEIFEDFGRIDVLCLIENRYDEIVSSDDTTDDGFAYDTCAPVVNETGEVMRSLNVNIQDVRSILTSFYPLLKKEKPVAPPLQFFDHIPAGARRVIIRKNRDDDSDDSDMEDEEEKSSTSLVLYLTTPESFACRAGRSWASSRVRTIEAVLEGLNAEAVAREERVRACTAVIGTLDGEVPFWRFDRERFLLDAKEAELKRAQNSLKGSNRASNSFRPGNTNSNNPNSAPVPEKGRSPSFEVIQSFMPKRFFKASRRAARSRGATELENLSMVEVDDGEEDPQSLVEVEVESVRPTEGMRDMSIPGADESKVETEASFDDDEDLIPPPSPVHFSVATPEKLTAESLSHSEACQWVLWGLSRGRLRILVGYDVLFLQSAWVPDAFLHRLFSFTSKYSRNLLPIRTKENYMPTTQSARRAQAKYDAERRRRQNAREVVTLIFILFLCFSLPVALGMLFLVALWHRTVTSSEGHAATERALAMVLYIVALRRRWFIKGVWDAIRVGERKVFGTISKGANDFSIKMEEFWKRKNKRKSMAMTDSKKQG